MFQTFLIQLLPLLGINLLSALLSSFLVTPFVTIIDVAIILNTNGAKTLRQSIGDLNSELLFKPIQFFQKIEFIIVFSVCIIIYFTSLSTTTIFQLLQIEPGLGSFIITTTVSLFMALMKDAKLAQICCQIDKQKIQNMKVISFVFFAIRDLIVLFFSFYLPPVFTAYITSQYQVNILIISIASQLTLPVVSEFIISPFHILGLDYYFNQDNLWIQRWNLIKQQYLQCALMKSLKVFPVFGIGILVNKGLNSYLIQQYNSSKN